MIHSLAGGSIKPLKINNWSKVELLEGVSKGQIFWYITNIDLAPGDLVLVPLGSLNSLYKARVLRVDKNVSAYSSPIPQSRAKYVYSKVE